MNIIKAVLTTLVTMVLFTGSAFAYEVSSYEQLGWDLKKTHDRTDTAVFSKHTDESRVKKFLGVTIIDTDLPTLLTVVSDIDGMADWVYKMGDTYVVERISATELYQYVVIKTPYPVKDRDLVVHTKANQNPQTGVVEVVSDFVDGKVEDKDGMVRIREGKNLFRFTPLENGKVMVEFETLVDPGGFIPAWAVNLMATGAPYYSLKKLHRLCKTWKREKREVHYKEFDWPRK